MKTNEIKAGELAKQLRMGNLLYFKGTNEIQCVELIHKNHFDCRSLEFGDFTINGEYEPIPLTEELLLRLGFETISEIGILADKHHGIVEDKDKYIFMPFCTNDKDCYIEVYFLHELQNIYAVFKQELTLKNN